MDNVTETCPVLEFAVATDVTTLAHTLNKEYDDSNYTKIYLIPDTKNLWLIRILPNHNEEYDIEEGKFLVERNDIDYDDIQTNDCNSSTDLIGNFNAIKQVLIDDELDNWDVHEYDSEEDAICSISDGFGIIGEDGVKTYPED